MELTMPKMGESVAEATIIKWLKNEGERIELEESVLEIATDKVDSEVPSPVEGVLVKKLFGENDLVQVGQAIALIETSAAGDATPVAASEAAKEINVQIETAQSIASNGAMPSSESMDIQRESNGRFYSPLVRNIAKEEGIAQAELDALQGSGAEGRVTKSDLLAYLAQGRPSAKGLGAAQISNASSAQVSSASSAPQPSISGTAPVRTAAQPMSVSASEGDEIIEMDRMRKLISDHMVMSKSVSPHVTSFVEVDVTNLVRWRDAIKDSFQKREGEKITFTPIFIEALARAIQDFPMINIQVDGTRIIKKRDINIGMAAALPSGNLIVPVIRNADRLNLLGLTKAVNDLANRARQNKLKPEEIQGGTYTLTNVGTFGNVLGTPIINQPQVAIMAAGAIVKKPAVIETPEGDVIAIRHKMFLSHSYDHRVVDGALGGSFVRRVADYLEAFDPRRAL